MFPTGTRLVSEGPRRESKGAAQPSWSSVAAPRRALYFAAGTVSLTVGAVGAFVPGLPTTVFVLVASYCFARSSRTAHRRLVEHRLWGAYLRAAERRCMPRRAKVSALAAMWTSILISVLLTARVNLALSLSIAGAGLIGTGVILFYVGTTVEG